MATYNSPTLHNGELNTIINTNDMNTYNNDKILSQTLADQRYLQLTGGYMSGNLNILGNEIITSALNTQYIKFSTNTISQTSGMLGFLYADSGIATQGSMSNGLHNHGVFITLPIGVFIVSVQCNIQNQWTGALSWNSLGLGISIPNDGGEINTDYYDRSTRPFTIPVGGSEIRTRTFIYANSTANSTIYFEANYNWTLNSCKNNIFIIAIRIA